MGWIWGALMPHPPVLVPEVGHGREREAARTLDGMEMLLAGISDLHKRGGEVERLLVLSPHQPYAGGVLLMNAAGNLKGSLAPFGAPGVSFDLTTQEKDVIALARHLEERGVPVGSAKQPDLTPDHGTLVPLYFLSRCFASGRMPPIVIASPIGLSLKDALALGGALADFDDGKRWGLLASGDLSHKLLPGAPAGYHPDGSRFDQAVVAALQHGDTSHLMHLPPEVLRNAGECGLRSVLALLGLAKEPLHVMSYEGPFGVGYSNALWAPGMTAGMEPKENGMKQQDETLLPKLARLTVERFLSGDTGNVWDLPASLVHSGIWKRQSACFVSIKTHSGALRGCIGTLAPTCDSLGKEVMQNAISAATQDRRFLPVTASELESVVFSVDVLSAPELIHSLDELDPQLWGVIVTKGNQRGVLLPALDGVDTVEQQLTIAAQKAGLPGWQGAAIQRFSVERFPEA